ncbi:MAG: BamA/TamA family outer membrane protein [Microcoleaceae cyanobacterium]
MRLSPVLVAVIATSVSVGYSNSANAQPSIWTFGETYFSSISGQESSPPGSFQPIYQGGDSAVFPGLPATEVSIPFDNTPVVPTANVGAKPLLSKSTKLGLKASGDPTLEKFQLPDEMALNSPAVKSQPEKWAALSRIQAEWKLNQSQAKTVSQNAVVLSKVDTVSEVKASAEIQPDQTSTEIGFQLDKTKSFTSPSFETIATSALLIAKADIDNKYTVVEPYSQYNFDKLKPNLGATSALSIAKADIDNKSTVVEPYSQYNFDKLKPNLGATSALSIAKADIDNKSTVINSTTESLSDFSFNKFKPEIQLPFEIALSKIEDGKADLSIGVIPNSPTLVQDPPSPVPEPQVLVAEIVIDGVEDPDLQALIYDAIATEPGRTTTRTLLQQDINAIFALGLFRNVRATPEDTPLGVRVTFEVELNPPLTDVVIEGNEVLPPEIIEESFAGQFNEIINLNQIEQAVEQINAWYQENGYVLAQIIEAPAVTPDGTVTLQVAEGVIEDIRIRFLNADGEDIDEDGNPVEGNTRDFIITREIQLEPGDVFNQQTAQQDLRRVFGLGIFEDVRLELEPGSEDPTQAVMVVNIVERSTGSINLGGGVSSATGLFGTVSYQQTNVGGNNQQLATEVQLGERILLLDASFTDPWIAGDPYRTSYTVSVFRRREVPNIFEEGTNDVRLPNGDRVRIIRTGGGISFTRPFAENPFVDPDWIGSVGFRYQRVQATDADIDVTPRDDAAKLLTASDSGEDDLITFQFGVARDRRNNPQFPTSGYLFRIGSEQSVPVGSGAIFYNRLRANYTFYVPIRIFNFMPGSPQALAFNVQAGTVIGEFPPYEAFSLGGANTVRGWEEGALAAGRSFVLGSVEYRFPIFGTGSFLIGGALFVDAATTLGTQSTVQGNPGGIRGKPGSGIGFGGGLRIQSPIGPIRIDYGINNEGDGQVHFGIGERF